MDSVTGRGHTQAILYDSFAKSRIASLPRIRFEGKIIVIDKADDAARAVKELVKVGMVGIDSETRPNFTRNNHHKVALLQVATLDTAYLFRLCRIGLPDVLTDWLQNGEQLKIGLSLKDDFHQLHERGDFKTGRVLELQEYVRKFGITDMGLQKLCANVLGGQLSKHERLSNWEAEKLSQRQLCYAATDAWVCLCIFKKLRQLRRSGNYTLINRVAADNLVGRVIRELYAAELHAERAEATDAETSYGKGDQTLTNERHV